MISERERKGTAVPLGRRRVKRRNVGKTLRRALPPRRDGDERGRAAEKEGGMRRREGRNPGRDEGRWRRPQRNLWSLEASQE